MLLKIFHLSVFLLNSFTLWYDQNYVEVPIPEEFRARSKHLPFKCRFLFLTIWVLVLQTLYFGIAFCNDLFGTTAPQPKNTPWIRRIKDTLFSLLFPASLFVSTMFWSIYAIDKDLIMPDYLQNVLPDWANHVMHTTVAIFSLIELIFSNISYPSRKLGFSVGILFALSYIAMLARIFLEIGSMIYPVLDTFSVSTRFAVLLVMASYGLSLYFVGEKINSVISCKAKKVVGKRRAD